MPSSATSTTSVRQMMPQVKLPSRSVRAALTSEDRALLEKILAESVEYIAQQIFYRRNAEQRLFGGKAQLAREPTVQFLPASSVLEQEDEDTPPARRRDMVTFSPQQEQLAFKRFNYARYRLFRLLRNCRGKRLTLANARQAIAWQRRALEIRAEIVQANVPLVLAMAKHTRRRGVDFYELISEGNMALLRAINRFACDRGFKFSTYACSAIIKSFSRIAMRAARYHGRFPNSYDPQMQQSDHLETRRREMELACVAELQAIVANNTVNFSEVEQKVIRARFALDSPGGNGDPQPVPMTLEQIGQIIGVTKERVRQIQNQALAKLKGALEASILAA